ncbi:MULTISPECIES: hypothetical protein [unclassified Streptomyces]|uniref:hypothetical protein n=1 Tax=unclassified Streptomyces TaxID=2593676 RepID=UPI0011CDECC5|nr:MULTISPECIES: hypothetical protein [unclassified Streptomyces]TXS68861.1 hypothetical protein EAO69_27135 [Streptomyces sp. me109]
MVTVSLTGASQEDAATVFDVLRAAFPVDEPPDPPLQDLPTDHPVVWTAEFEPTQTRMPTESTSLKGELTATLQGGYAHVDLLCEALEAAFAVDRQGTASGDQEKEVDLQLRTKRR